MLPACSGDDGETGSEGDSEATTETSGTSAGETEDASESATATDASSSGGTTGATTDTSSDATTDATSEGPTTTGDVPSSPGCGQAPLHASGGVQVTIDAGPEGDGERGFYLSLPANYDPETPHKLIVGYPGTNWVGEQIRPYLALEGGADDEIFVYLDPLWRDFAGWGNLGGWLLGPYAAPADGEQDLVFTEAVLDYMEENYCVDTTRVFATGHSWGGDMAQVVSCFLGDRFRASVPVAANRPYWFESAGSWVDCAGQTEVWTYFGIADDHFAAAQEYPGQFGDECRDFWLDERGCSGDASDLGIGASEECLEYVGCSAGVRYCLYGPDAGHQVPSYYAEETMTWFRAF